MKDNEVTVLRKTEREKMSLVIDVIAIDKRNNQKLIIMLSLQKIVN